MKKRQIISVILIALLAVSSVCVMTSCGKKEEEKKPATLEEYMATADDADSELQKISESMSNEVVDGAVDVKENSIVMTLTMKEVYDSEYFDAFNDSFADEMEGYSDRFSEIIDDMEKESGISGIDIQVIVLNGDGAEIYSDTFTN